MRDLMIAIALALIMFAFIFGVGYSFSSEKISTEKTPVECKRCRGEQDGNGLRFDGEGTN